MFDNLTVRNKFLVVGLVPTPCFVAIAVLGFVAGSVTIGGIATASAVLTALVAFRVGTRAADRVAALTERLAGLDVDATGGGNDEPARGEPAADEIGATERAATDLIDRVAAAQENHHIETTARTRSLLHAAAAESMELIGHQLDAIDWLEAREDDSARLDRMFRLDHVTARLHRNAARLLVLAGHDSIHSRSTPAPMADVIRVAMGEMEDFARIELRTLDEVMIAPTAACEVAQLLSELLANSLTGSVDDAPIEIHATHLDDGSYRVTIIDRGNGMTADDMATAQARVETPAGIGDLPDHRIGLNVVGQLARHLGATIDFSETAGSGVTVDLRLPVELVAAATVVRPVSMKYPEQVRDEDQGTTPQNWTPPATPLRTSEKQDRAPEDRVPENRAPEDRAPEDRAPENRASEDRALEDRGPQRQDPAPRIESPPEPVTAAVDDAWKPPPTPPRSHDRADVPDRQQAPAPQPIDAEAEHQPGARPAVLTKRTRRGLKPAAVSGPPVRVSNRSPKKTRSMITSYRKGLQQGREEAPDLQD